ncbi:MAG: tetratricopeptide repeat protein [candidate division Zixibacteria bacterium]|nr:tetratricopeptide repeat protein [candidate division Zixibacteria bacterium]
MFKALKVSLVLIILALGSVAVYGADTDETYFDFLKNTFNKHDKKLNDFLKTEFQLFLGLFPNSELAGEASYLLAQTFLDRHDENEAFAILMKTLYLYPEGAMRTAVSAEAQRIVATNGSYKQQQDELRTVIDGEFENGALEDRYYRYLKFLRELNDRKLYDWTLDEYYYFINRFEDDDRIEQIHRWVADMYASKGEAEAAVAGYQKYEKLFPVDKNLPYVIINRAKVLNEELKEYALASSLLTQVIEDYPDTKYASTAVYARAGIKADRLRDYGGAIADYRLLLAKHPQHEKAVDALFEIASINADRMKAYRAAIDTYNEVVEKYPDSPRGGEALKKSAELYLKIDDYFSAAKQYARVAEVYPESEEAPALLYEAGDIALGKMKDFQQAKDFYNRVAEKYPASEYAIKARQKVERINEKLGQQ